MSEAPSVVLDASAVLAFLFSEPGGEQVRPLLAGATISAVNMSETIGRLVRGGMPLNEAQAAFSYLDLAIAPFGEREAIAAAGFLSSAQPVAWLSLGDRACLATAATLGLPAVTADRQWVDLKPGVDVSLIR